MCLIVVSYAATPAYPLVLVANRDEYYARPSAPFARWADHPRLVGGRDLKEGGTWLAVSMDGRIAAVTNHRSGVKVTRPRSRGHLVVDFLLSAEPPRDFAARIARQRDDYAPFSLLFGTPRELFYYSSVENLPRPLTPGIFALSNDLLDVPWPKVVHAKQALTRALDDSSTRAPSDSSTSAPSDSSTRAPSDSSTRAPSDSSTRAPIDVRKLSALLLDRTVPPDAELPDTGVGLTIERFLAPPFIAGEDYGTRSSTAIAVAQTGHVSAHERRFGPHGTEIGDTQLDFELQLQS